MRAPRICPFVRQATESVRSDGLNRSKKLIEVLKKHQFVGSGGISGGGRIGVNGRPPPF
jgi:hypothetical protein